MEWRKIEQVYLYPWKRHITGYLNLFEADIGTGQSTLCFGPIRLKFFKQNTSSYPWIYESYNDYSHSNVIYHQRTSYFNHFRKIKLFYLRCLQPFICDNIFCPFIWLKFYRWTKLVYVRWSLHQPLTIYPSLRDQSLIKWSEIEWTIQHWNGNTLPLIRGWWPCPLLLKSANVELWIPDSGVVKL